MVLLAFLIGQGVGNVEWIRIYGGDDYDWGEAVAVDSAGRYVVVGPTWIGGGFDPDMWILRVDSSTGDTLWTLVHGESGIFEWVRDVVVDEYGDYVIVGDTGYRDIIVTKVDTDGNIIWNSIIPDTAYQEAIGVGTGSSGNYYVGVQRGDGFRLIEVDPVSGNAVSMRSYTTSQYLSLRAFTVHGNMCLFAGGIHNSTYDLYLFAVDCISGDSLLSVVVDAGGNDFVEDVAVDGMGNFILAGGAGYGTDSSKLLVAKIDENGNAIWIRQYGVGTSWGNGVDVSPSGYYVVAGSYGENGSDFWMLRVNPSSGDTLWSVVLGDTSYQEAQDVVADRGGGYVMVGSTQEEGDTDLGMVKVVGEEPIQWIEKPVVPSMVRMGGGWLLQNKSMNPVPVRIYDVKGRLLESFTLPAGGVRVIRLSRRGVFLAEWGGGRFVLVNY